MMLRFYDCFLFKVKSFYREYFSTIDYNSKHQSHRKANTFQFSGESSLLENYKCFDDRSSLDWVDGSELLANPEWDNERKKRWYYFYRPYNYGGNIARPQKEKIKKIEIIIEKNKKELIILRASVFFVTIATLFLIFFLGKGEGLNQSAFVLIASMIAILYLIYRHGCIENNYFSMKKDILELRHEIDCLIDQQQLILKQVPSCEEIEKMFWNDMVDLEKHFIETVLNKNYSFAKQEARKYYSEYFIDEFFDRNKIEPPVFPLIPSWGLLQQSQYNEAHNSQRTGLFIFNREIGNKVATWRNSTTGKQFYRIVYVQFLFFQDKSLYAVSVYYDFISKKQRGIKKDVFSYSHIAHHSYNEEDISHMLIDPLITELKLPESLTNNLYGHQTKSISFSSSSGLSYKCVLPDKDVSDGLIKWLDFKEKESFEGSEHDGLSDIDKKEILNKKVSTDDVIFTLAEATFRELGRKTEKFAIREGSFINN